MVLLILKVLILIKREIKMTKKQTYQEIANITGSSPATIKSKANSSNQTQKKEFDLMELGMLAHQKGLTKDTLSSKKEYLLTIKKEDDTFWINQNDKRLIGVGTSEQLLNFFNIENKSLNIVLNEDDLKAFNLQITFL